MTDEIRAPAPPVRSAEALVEWTANVEDLLRGIAHALNNRAAALSAVVELSRDPTADDIASTSSILAGELVRVGELTAAVRILAPDRAGVEAFAPADAAADTARVLSFHSDQRVRAAVLDAGAAQPIRGLRWLYARALASLVIAARSAAPGGAIRVAVTAQGDWVSARVAGVTERVETLSPYAAQVARAMGGEPLADGGGFRVPSLAALRQREGR